MVKPDKGTAMGIADKGTAMGLIEDSLETDVSAKGDSGETSSNPVSDAEESNKD